MTIDPTDAMVEHGKRTRQAQSDADIMKAVDEQLILLSQVSRMVRWVAEGWDERTPRQFLEELCQKLDLQLKPHVFLEKEEKPC